MRRLFWPTIIALVIAAAFAGWHFFNRSAPGFITEQEGERAVAQLQRLSSTPALDYWLGSDALYYAGMNGTIYRIGSDGSEEAIYQNGGETLGALKASPDGMRIIARFGNHALPAFAVFSVSERAWQALPENTVSAAWHPASSDRLLILIDRGNQSELRALTLSTGQSSLITALAIKGVDVEWVAPETAVLAERPSAFAPSSAWMINLSTDAVTALARATAGFAVEWFGEQGLAFTGTSPRDGLLSIITADRTLTPLVLPGPTLPIKCALGELYYCAVPESIPQNIMLPDDYMMRKFISSDILYEIEPETGFVTRLFDGTTVPLDAIHLKRRGGSLYLLNRADQSIYRLTL